MNKIFSKTNILMISYYFPPIKSIGVIRAYYLHLELKKYFHAVHVITTSNRNRLQQEELPVKADSVWGIPTFDYRTFTNLRKKRRTHFSEEKKGRGLRYLLKINNSFPFNFLIGEGGIVYILCGFVIASNLIRKQKISHIYSSFMPFSDHIIAWLITILHPKKIIWVADFRDLHVDPIYRHVVLKNFQHWVWRKLLSRASFITTVSEGLAKHLHNYHPKIHVMRNGFGHLHYSSHQSMLEKANKFTISYTGSYYKEESPVHLFECIKELILEGIIAPNNIQIKYAGKDGATWTMLIQKYGIDFLFSNEGLVSLKRAIEIQLTSHINLLLSSSNSDRYGMLSGKFYEYLAAGVPIVLIISGEHDPEFTQIFNELQCGKIFLSEKSQLKSLKDYLENQYSNWLSTENSIASVVNQDKLNEFKWPHLAEEFLKKMSYFNENVDF